MPMKHSGFNRCSNPFGLQKHSNRKGLRHPSQDMLNKNSGLCKADLLCAGCRKQMGIIINQNNSIETVEEVAVREKSPPPNVTHNFNLRTRTKRPVRKETSDEPSPVPVKKIKKSGGKEVENETDSNASTTSSYSQNSRWDIPRLMTELTQKFHNADTDRSTKIQILSLMPQRWDVATTAKTIGSTLYLVRSAKALYKDKGILSTPNARLDQTVPSRLKSRVVAFYQHDEVSIQLPGIKNYIGIRDESGTKIHQQKRLLLCNLKELHQLFKERNARLKIGFSTFASLKPQHCELAGFSATHTPSVCALHENMKLMFDGCNLSKLTEGSEHHLTSYLKCLKFLKCAGSDRACYLGSCDKCPSNELLHEILIRVFETNNIDHVSYKQWIPKPRATLVTHTASGLELAAEFCDQAKLLSKHSFVAKQQSDFIKSIKGSPPPGGCLVVCDFAENYSFPIQDVVNGFCWNNNQATLYPVEIYFANENSQLTRKSLCIMSDCLDHDPTTIYMFSRVVVDFIRTFIVNLSKVIYTSASHLEQFKNSKNFANVYYHEKDFGIPAEWHFFATEHGKPPCDGITGTIRRLATKFSLQLPLDKQITTSQKLYEWASVAGNLPNIAVRYVDRSEYNVATNIIKDRFAKAKAIPKIEELHCLIPGTDNTVLTKIFSTDTEHKLHSMFESQSPYTPGIDELENILY